MKEDEPQTFMMKIIEEKDKTLEELKMVHVLIILFLHYVNTFNTSSLKNIFNDIIIKILKIQGSNILHS